MPQSTFRRGDFVAAKWTDRQYYIATVGGPNGPNYSVLYADGDQGVLPPEDLVAIPTTPVFNIGDRVLARWRTAQMFPARVAQKLPQGYVVQWDDGDAPLLVPVGALTYLAWAKLEPPPAIPAPGPSDPNARELSIYLPGNIMPLERGERFAEPLMDLLEQHQLGQIVEEGTSVKEINGQKIVQGAHIYIKLNPAADLQTAIATIRTLLQQRNAPPNSTLTDPAGNITPI